MGVKNFNEHTSMLNSYKVLTGKQTYRDMLEKNEEVYFVFNPTIPVIPMDNDVYDQVRLYFEEIEDYRKCAEIHWAKCKALAEDSYNN
tara:strand:- start:139 stop:402 length:264 start_codon:yes stop_codon:yes gene_type:complete